MKRIKIILSLLFVCFLFFNALGQEMKWIASPPEQIPKVPLLRNPDLMVCYDLEYTPDVSGTLTSYTTGFYVDCWDESIKIYKNKSYVIKDNSREIYACKEYRKVLLNCSGNTGNLDVKKGIPIVLHQLCFRLPMDVEVNIYVDPVTQLTVSIDEKPNRFETEFPEFKEVPLDNQNGNNYSPDSIQLNAQAEFNDIHLNWHARDLDFSQSTCLIERSEGQEAFHEIVILDIDGKGGVNSEFSFIDKDLLTDMYRYKVRCLDGEGELIFSNIAYEEVSDLFSEILVFPNPTNDYINVFIPSGMPVDHISMFDAKNRFLFKKAVKAGFTNKISVNTLQAGMYNLMIDHQGKKESLQIAVLK